MWLTGARSTEFAGILYSQFVTVVCRARKGFSHFLFSVGFFFFFSYPTLRFIIAVIISNRLNALGSAEPSTNRTTPEAAWLRPHALIYVVMNITLLIHSVPMVIMRWRNYNIILRAYHLHNPCYTNNVVQHFIISHSVRGRSLLDRDQSERTRIQFKFH